MDYKIPLPDIEPVWEDEEPPKPLDISMPWNEKQDKKIYE